MCGIAGYWNYRSQRPASEAVLGRMVSALRHRGPDECGTHVDNALGLGSTRLRVVDVEHGRQPMSNEWGSTVAVFNGEIYNHVELRHRLERRGHHFKSRSDTEVLVHAYDEWGTECVRNFNGMFAFAIWDGKREELMLARDHLGIKPLYVCDTADGVIFGSELKAILATGLVAADPDLEAIDDFLTYEYVPAPATVIRGIHKLIPGAWMRYSRTGNGSMSMHRFWQPAPGDRPASIAEAAQEIQDGLRQSVRMRLAADVPVGAFLSGGIDSSIVVTLMAQEVQSTPRTYSIGFEDASYDESKFALMMAGRLNTVHRQADISVAACETAVRIADAFDEPFADVSAFPTLQVSELARRDVTVALSGDGGDELFAGYDVYRAHQWAHRLRRITSSAPFSLVERLIAWAPPARIKKGPINLAKRFTEALHRPADLEHARWWVFWDLLERRSLYTPLLREQLAGRDCFGHYRQRLEEGSERGFEGLNRQLYADITGYLPDDILVKLDRMSMAVSLEARVPFLDPGLVDYTLGLPAEWKLRGQQGKWILRQAFRAQLPAAIRSRTKQGFSVPLKNWLRGPLRPLLGDVLSQRRIGERGWFDPRETARLMREHMEGHANHAHRLWCLAALELSIAGLERRAVIEQEPMLPTRAGASP